jgi:dTDP-glucose 4,6-dehydratase
MQHWLITGGAGFIGSNFVQMAAASSDLAITVVDALTYAGNLQAIDPLIRSGRIRFVRGNICDAAFLRSLFTENKFCRILHFAAESHVDRSIMGPQAFLETNVMGTFNLLEATRDSWKRSQENLFVHVSTDEVFGDLGVHDPAATESNAYLPSSPYAASKAASDHLVRAWFRTFGLPSVITNCSNNYGPWQFPEKLIPLMISNAFSGQSLPVYGDGMQIRDWLHVEDHCSALLAVADRGRAGETYLVGGRNEQPNIRVVETICDAVDEELGQNSGTSRQLITYVTDRPGHDRRYSINPAKTESELGWRPVRSFDQSIRELVGWYKSHAAWVDSIRSGSYRDYYERQYGGRN